MQNIATLQGEIESDRVALVNAVGVPRSMSTAFCRALAQSGVPSAYVNEPVNRENNDPEVAAGYILDGYGTIAGRERAVVITKNMASYLGLTAFRALESLSTVTLWHVRDPCIQIGSLITRLVNDLYVQPGADTISQEAIYPHLEGVCDFLRNSPKSFRFSKTGWASIAELHATPAQSTRLAIDGTEFSNNPEVSLRMACTALDVPYSAAMKAGWRRGFSNVVNRNDTAETLRSAWTSQAAASREVTRNTRAPLDLNRLPQDLLDHITQVAMPAYEVILAG